MRINLILKKVAKFLLLIKMATYDTTHTVKEELETYFKKNYYGKKR